MIGKICQEKQIDDREVLKYKQKKMIQRFVKHDSCANIKIFKKVDEASSN